MLMIYKASLFLNIFFSIIGAMFKIQHWPYGSRLVLFGMVLALPYIIIALKRIFESRDKSIHEKLLWLIGLIILSWITGIIYYYRELKRKK